MFSWQTDTWRQRFADQPIPQALLIVGDAAHGRATFARDMVSSRLCRAHGVGDLACGRCQDCRWMAAGHHPDLHLIDPDAEATSSASVDHEAGVATPQLDAEREVGRPRRRAIAVEDIRRASEGLRLSAAGAGLRVLLIERADAMNTAAANALLKLLEEPPAGVAIVLSTGHPARLPATVRSRCQRVNLPPATEAQAREWLIGQGVPATEAAERLTRIGGAPLRALELEPGEAALRQVLDAACTKMRTAADAVAAAATIPEERLAEAVEYLQRRVASELQSQARAAHTDRRAAARMPRALDADARLRRLRRLVDHPLNTRTFREELMLVAWSAQLGRVEAMPR
jgi:DNA polymerase-3 subunit delta'